MSACELPVTAGRVWGTVPLTGCRRWGRAASHSARQIPPELRKSATGSSATPQHFECCGKAFFIFFFYEYPLKKCRCPSLQQEKKKKDKRKAQTIRLENTVSKLPVLQKLPFHKWDNDAEISTIECVQIALERTFLFFLNLTKPAGTCPSKFVSHQTSLSQCIRSLTGNTTGRTRHCSGQEPSPALACPIPDTIIPGVPNNFQQFYCSLITNSSFLPNAGKSIFQ